MSINKIYLDNASTTSIYEEVIQEMNNVMRSNYGNPSSTHSIGLEAKSSIENARKNIAQKLGVLPQEIIFTSCGTESNNLIIRSCVNHLNVKRIISTTLEHKCVLETCLEMKKLNSDVEVIFLKVNSLGEIDLNELETILSSDDKKTLVTLMHANNEIGNLIDLNEIGLICKKHNALFHTDTVQTLAHIPLNFGELPIDFASASAHKFHGPKGIGFAYIKKGTRLKSMITGGGQERNLRSGTENIYGIVGMSKAFEISINELESHKNHIEKLKSYAIDQFSEKIKNVKFSGNSANLDKSLCTVLSVLLPYKNELIGFQLDLKGISISQGSACSSGAAKPSTVMMTILSADEQEKTTPIRISFSHFNTNEEIDFLINSILELQ